MASVFKVFGLEGDAKEWFAKQYPGEVNWEYDETLSCYRTGNIYLTTKAGSASFDDLDETVFFDCGTDFWIKLAGDKELIYGYYSEDLGSAEFIHIKDGACIREYMECDFGEVITDEGDDPVFGSWVDVATYVDSKLF